MFAEKKSLCSRIRFYSNLTGTKHVICGYTLESEAGTDTECAKSHSLAAAISDGHS